MATRNMRTAREKLLGSCRVLAVMPSKASAAKQARHYRTNVVTPGTKVLVLKRSSVGKKALWSTTNVFNERGFAKGRRGSHVILACRRKK